MAAKSIQKGGFGLFRLKQTIGEASSLCPVTSRKLLHELGADAACWVVHDEEPLQTAVSILSVSSGVFTVTALRIDTPRAQRTTDAESVFVHEGRVTVVGSGFIGGKGTIDPRRAFVGTFWEEDVQLVRKGGSTTADVPGNVKLLGLELTAAANTAIERAGIKVAVPSKAARKAAKKASLPGGVPINIEGACVDSDGTITLGLRSPVASTGDPILLRLKGDLAVGVQAVADASVGVLKLGASPKEPVGVRDLAYLDGRLHMVVAHADSAMHAERSKRAPSRHVSVDAGGADLRFHRDFGSQCRVEGLARPPGADESRADGWWYVIDDEKAVVVLSPT